MADKYTRIFKETEEEYNGKLENLGLRGDSDVIKELKVLHSEMKNSHLGENTRFSEITTQLETIIQKYENK